MAKRIFFSLLLVMIIIGGLTGIKSLQIKSMIAQGESYIPPPEPVTTIETRSDMWGTGLTAVGTLKSMQGIDITAEISGKVVLINFESGAYVKAGQVLIQQDFSLEGAQLRSAEAAVAIARLTQQRSLKLLPDNVIPRADYDNAEAKLEQTMAQADAIRAIIAQKTIKAPFSGRIGLRQVSLGQILNPGDLIVTLQSLDPIYVEFQLPQRHLEQLKTGMQVRVTTDEVSDSPTNPVGGILTAIQPEIDPSTRTIRLQATLSNKDEWLRPGMFVNVTLALPDRKQVLAVPTTAILNAAYGDSVYIVEQDKQAQGAAPTYLVRRQFVKTGEKRGDFVEVIEGLSAGQQVVSTGVFKLRNNQSVVIDNTLAPEFKYMPDPENA